MIQDHDTERDVIPWAVAGWCSGEMTRCRPAAARKTIGVAKVLLHGSDGLFSAKKTEQTGSIEKLRCRQNMFLWVYYF
jgi:hypothetical protein